MEFTDQLHRTVRLSHWPPRRIISLVPSQSELLADLNLEAEVVGITKFCIHPQSWFESKSRVGGTKTLNFEKIEALQPDLIIGNKEENEQQQIEWLTARYPVWMSDISTLPEALDMIRAIGQLTDRIQSANQMADDIQLRFNTLPVFEPIQAAYLIWRKPYMAAGAGTFIHEMMQKAGFQNVFGHLGRYPELNLEQLNQSNPAVLLLSSEPYPFQEKHLRELQEVCPGAKILLADGELFSWYGSRLLHSPAYFKHLREKLITAK